jgi:hypothetical protein
VERGLKFVVSHMPLKLKNNNIGEPPKFGGFNFLR